MLVHWRLPSAGGCMWRICAWAAYCRPKARWPMLYLYRSKRLLQSCTTPMDLKLRWPFGCLVLWGAPSHWAFPPNRKSSLTIAECKKPSPVCTKRHTGLGTSLISALFERNVSMLRCLTSCPCQPSFNGYVERLARASSTCLAAAARNRCSAPCEWAGHIVGPGHRQPSTSSGSKRPLFRRPRRVTRRRLSPSIWPARARQCLQRCDRGDSTCSCADDTKL